jgi:hypothetical protein
MKGRKAIGTLIIAGLGIWALSKAKPAVAVPAGFEPKPRVEGQIPLDVVVSDIEEGAPTPEQTAAAPTREEITEAGVLPPVPTPPLGIQLQPEYHGLVSETWSGSPEYLETKIEDAKARYKKAIAERDAALAAGESSVAASREKSAMMAYRALEWYGAV